MGPNEFDLEATGTQQGNTAAIAGVIPGTQMRLTATLTKPGDVPPRVGNVAY